MPSRLFVLVKLLVVAGLQLYLAQSLVVVVEHTSRVRPWQNSQPLDGWNTEHNRGRSRGFLLPLRASRKGHRHGFTSGTTAPFEPGQRKSWPFVGSFAQRHSMGSDSTTAISASSVDKEENESSSSSSRRALSEILDELTDRGITFSPMASRAELEELLKTELDGAGSDADFESPSASGGDDSARKSIESFSSQPPEPPATRDDFSVENYAKDDSSHKEVEKEKPYQRSRFDPRQQGVEERLQRRSDRRRRDTTAEYWPSSRHRRPRRREGVRKDRRETIASDSFDGYNDLSDGRKSYDRRRQTDPVDESLDGTRLRRRRRMQRREQAPQSLLGSIADNLPVDEVVDFGSRASRIARKKTGKLWKDFVDMTYEDDDFEDTEYYKPGFPREKQRRSTPRSRSRRRSRRQSRSMDEKAPSATDPSVDPYYDNSGKEDKSDRYKSLREQEMKRRRKARQERQEPSPRRRDSFTKRLAKKLPISQILEALNERNIRYSPTSSRKELEDLLRTCLEDDDVVAVKKAEEDIQVIEVESISPEDWKKQQEEKLQQKQMEQNKEGENQNEEQPPQQSHSNGTSQKPNPFRSEAPPAGTGARIVDSNTHQSSGKSSHRSPRFSANAAKAYGTGSAERMRRRQQRRTTASVAATSSSSPPQKNSSASNNPVADMNESSTRTSAARGRRSREHQGAKDESVSPSGTNRRIYSPYGKSSPGKGTSNRRRRKKDDIEDDFDRISDFVEDDLWKVGDFLGDSVDNFFWGNVDDGKTAPPNRTRRRNANDATVSSKDTRRRNVDASTNRRNRNRHWKDRVEENLDRVMGIPRVDENTYNRWTEKEADDAKYEHSKKHDAVSYIKTRKSFWEDDQSILSILFGRDWGDSRPPRAGDVGDIIGAFRSGRTLTLFLQNLLVIGLRTIGSLCKWASVRNTIPRPVVFLGVFGTGFVSYPRNRIRNTLLAILSIRVIGEYMSGPTPSVGRSSREERNSNKEDDDYEADD